MNNVCLVVGTDRLGNFPSFIEKKYNCETVHWTGREKKLPSKLPKNCEKIVLITGFCNHPFAKRVKELAKTTNTPIIFVKRGLAELKEVA